VKLGLRGSLDMYFLAFGCVLARPWGLEGGKEGVYFAGFVVKLFRINKLQ
jgi:hypothetical protein